MTDQYWPVATENIGWHLQSQSFNCIISISFRCTGEVHTKAGWVVFFWPPNATCSKSVPQNYHIPLPAELMTPMTYDLWLIFWDVSWKRTLFEQNIDSHFKSAWATLTHRFLKFILASVKNCHPKVSSCVGFSGSKQVQTRLTQTHFTLMFFLESRGFLIWFPQIYQTFIRMIHMPEVLTIMFSAGNFGRAYDESLADFFG